MRTESLGWSHSFAFPALSDTKSPLIHLSGVTFVISLAFHLSYFLSPIDYSISPAFPPFSSFYSIIGSFAVYRKDEKQKVLTTQASEITCQAQKKNEMKRKSGSPFFAFWFLNPRSSLVSYIQGFFCVWENQKSAFNKSWGSCAIRWLQRLGICKMQWCKNPS